MANKDSFIELVKTNLSPEVGETIMTIAEQFRAEGIQKGIMEMVDRMLSENVEMALIAKVSGLPLDKIRELKKNKDKH